METKKNRPFLQKNKERKDCSRQVEHYDGDDGEERQNEIIVNPVKFGDSKAIGSSSNEAPPKLKETSKELSVRQQTSSDVHVESMREIIPLQSDIDVTSTTEVIHNPDMTLMDEIQHAVVNIIPASENMEEGNIEKAQFQEIHQSVVQSTEVESQLAKAHEMSWPTVMQDEQTMEAFGKGADTNTAIQSGVMDNSNEAQN